MTFPWQGRESTLFSYQCILPSGTQKYIEKSFTPLLSAAAGSSPSPWPTNIRRSYADCTQFFVVLSLCWFKPAGNTKKDVQINVRNFFVLVPGPQPAQTYQTRLGFCPWKARLRLAHSRHAWPTIQHMWTRFLSPGNAQANLLRKTIGSPTPKCTQVRYTDFPGSTSENIRATHLCSNLNTQGNMQHRTWSIEANFMIWFPTLDISKESKTLWGPPTRWINGTLAFAFCMITHNTEFQNCAYHPVSTLVFTCVYIPDWFWEKCRNLGSLAKIWLSSIWKCYVSTISSL